MSNLGQENDPETGLDYYNARYYNPNIRRFTQADDIIQDQYNPQDLNRYSYVKNNPLRYTDPKGHFAWVPAIIIGGGSVLGATGAVSSYTLENPHATIQQKLVVGAGGAAIGGVASALTLYTYTSVIGTAIVGGASSGLQQVYKNAITGKPLDKNVFPEAAAGTVVSGATAGLVKNLNLVPNNVGSPIDLNKSRPFMDSFTKNSLNAINKATVPDLISTELNIITNSLSTISPNNNKTKKH